MGKGVFGKSDSKSDVGLVGKFASEGRSAEKSVGERRWEACYLSHC